MKTGIAHNISTSMHTTIIFVTLILNNTYNSRTK